MPIRSGAELRDAYLEYFRTLPDFPHPVVPSAPLVPPDDPTLLFTSAGMVQFKPLYSGDVELPYPRAASCQKCLRAGGKGSDLENVGKTLRHHTLFEMLGNFSFGDYFKRESIRFAWEFCTSPQWMALSKERLFPTIYGPAPEEIDREAESYWREVEVANPLVPLDASENFWGPAGDTGACGPCSEVKFFLGTDEELAAVRALANSGEAGLRELGRRIVEEGDLFLEIWNMVFPQFDQQRDGSRPLLKHKGIDTGAGLERMTVALNHASGGARTPYETDLLWPITTAAAQSLGVAYQRLGEGPETPEAARRRLAVNAVADHTRALVFCLAEGITPSNVGRGYVIRRIQRRALRFASLLGKDEPFMADLYDAVVQAAGAAYPEIKKNPDFIRRALRQEEETFLRTRERGQKLLDELIAQALDSGAKTIGGDDAFKLWDTYGYPVDLTKELAEDAGVAVDMGGYEATRARQKAESKKTWKGAAVGESADALDAEAERIGATDFLGYAYAPEPEQGRLLGIVAAGAAAQEIGEGQEGFLILDRTPFYAESGGQVGDTGRIATTHGEALVLDTQKTPHGTIYHKVRVERGVLRAGDDAESAVDLARRRAIVQHHSAVHLLQNALKRVLGDHITQQGSYVGPGYARFDFTHAEGVKPEQLRAAQDLVNELIMDDHEVRTDVLPIEEARRKGAIAPFGEKYGAMVRVVQMGPSVEFCGGTHLAHTSQAGQLRIVSESSIASGVRRIEVAAGLAAARAGGAEQFEIVAPLQLLLAAKGPEALDRVRALGDSVRAQEREIARLKQELAKAKLGDVAALAVALEGGARLVAVRMDGLDGNELRAVAESILEKLGDDGVAVAAGVSEGRVNIVAASGKNASQRYPAGKIVNALAQPLGGKGGGKPTLAQAGAKDAEKLGEVMDGATALLGAMG
ncbi:MAG: alanine--tRNA ligase [Candidatus Sumerlaeia bacterium]|nr:alanine--tRNA ligase [Candidatus Sumerlaeia bacterium]